MSLYSAKLYPVTAVQKAWVYKEMRELRNDMPCPAWWSKLVILVLRGQRKDDYEFEVSLINKANTLSQGEEGDERGEGEEGEKGKEGQKGEEKKEKEKGEKGGEGKRGGEEVGGERGRRRRIEKTPNKKWSVRRKQTEKVRHLN